MNYNPNHVRINEVGEFEGVCHHKPRRSFKARNYNTNPEIPVKYSVVPVAEKEVLAKTGLSTDKRSDAEKKIAQIIKDRQNERKYVPAIEEVPSCEIEEIEDMIRVIENGEVVAEAYNPSAGACTQSSDKAYADWAMER